MQIKRVCFGDFIRKIRLNDPREITISDMAKHLDISPSFLSDIENRRRRPFSPEKIEKFSEYFDLNEENRALMYDLASHENHEVPSDIEDIFLYNEVGDLARFALRQSKEGYATEEDWKKFIREIEDRKAENKGETLNNGRNENQTN